MTLKWKKVFTTIAPKDSNYTVMHLRIRLKMSVRTSMTELEYNLICIKRYIKRYFQHISIFHSLSNEHTGLHVYEVKIGVHYNQQGVQGVHYNYNGIGVHYHYQGVHYNGMQKIPSCLVHCIALGVIIGVTFRFINESILV